MELEICSLESVPTWLRTDDFTHCLSLVDFDIDLAPIEYVTRELGINWKVMRFRDTTNLKDPHCPTIENAQEILNWGSTIPNNGVVLVHCQAGISRSSSSALALLVQKEGNDDFSLQKCRKYIQRVRSIAIPNPLLVKYYDELLNCEGRLIKIGNQIRSETKFDGIIIDHRDVGQNGKR